MTSDLEIVDRLVTLNPLAASEWITPLQPAGDHLIVPAVEIVVTDSKDSSKSLFAAGIAAKFHGPDSQILPVELLVRALIDGDIKAARALDPIVSFHWDELENSIPFYLSFKGPERSLSRLGKTARPAGSSDRSLFSVR